MARKVSEKEYKRIIELRDLGLTVAVIAERLGITRKTVHVYLRAAKLNLEPYERPLDL